MEKHKKEQNLKNEGCKCQICGQRYKVDIIVPDKIWYKIIDKDKEKGGLLCGRCIIDKLEQLGYSAFRLIQI